MPKRSTSPNLILVSASSLEGGPKELIGHLAGSDPELAAGLNEIGVKVENLLRTEGLKREEYLAAGDREVHDPRVLKAQKDLEAGLAQLANAIVAKGLDFTIKDFAERRSELGKAFNAAVSHTETIYRFCIQCWVRVPPRHRTSPYCSSDCKRAARDKRRGPAKKEKRARSPEEG